MKRFIGHFKLRMVQLMYDKPALFLTFVFPVLLIMGLGYLFTEKVENQIAVTFLSDGITIKKIPAFHAVLEESSLFVVKESTGSADEMIEQVRREKINILIHVKDIDGRLNFVIFYVKKSIESDGVFLALKEILSRVQGDAHLPIIEAKPIEKRDQSYIYTVFPGVVGLILLIIGLMGTGARILEEREASILKKLKTIENSPFSFLFGLLFSRILASIAMISLMMFLVFYFFHLRLVGSYLLFSIVILLGLMSFLGIGIVLSNAAKNMEHYQGFVQIIQIPFVLLGGVFFSIEIFPEWLQVFSLFSPLTAFVVLFKKLLLYDIGIADVNQIYKEMSVLLFWGFGSCSLGFGRFRWE